MLKVFQAFKGPFFAYACTVLPVERVLRSLVRKLLAGTSHVISLVYQQHLQACGHLHLLVLHKVPRDLCTAFVVEQSSQTRIMAAVREAAAKSFNTIER